MKVIAELKEMYKITVGDNGMCMGQYYPEDDWKDSYYGETIKEIVEEMNSIYYKGLPRTFALEKVEILIYNDAIYDYRRISQLETYSKTNFELRAEAEEFHSLWNSDEYKNIRKSMIEKDKIREEREKKLSEIKAKEEKEKKELEAYLKLKNKYENI